ncbi:HD domain-containing protein [Amycolatopsis suaedae]|uniref:HD domain-containing protein n=1 Tax=Amycolatopsis suaedae TaxID=2510978 RepID=A0A4Q7J7M1_9PSEU|nr:HD domain-containing protein [Amycolatopsis suaedae]RZQ62353.1 HD domain-containing protein [Amycolatopsis suaedae]
MTATLDLPRTPLARQAFDLAAAAEEPYLFNHGIRCYLFGRELARARGALPGEHYDDELVFLVCVLHDIGLTERAPSALRFEVAGADLAARLLEDNGITDHRVDVVWDAIALHTTAHVHESPVFRRRRVVEIGIAQAGIGFDLGGGAATLPPGYTELVHRRYPRLGGGRALTEAILAQALAEPGKAPPMTLAGEVLHQKHPALPYRTWADMVDANRWGD